MCNEILKVAVIDSGIDIDNRVFENKKIKSVKYEKGTFTSSTSDNNQHGTIVSSIILKECENIELISVQILDENNKSSLKNLIEAIRYCIKEKVNVINMSLGICVNYKKCKLFEEICNEAIDLGIIIFSAENNLGKRAFPANFERVIKVTSTGKGDGEVYSVNLEELEISFSRSDYSLTHLGSNTCIEGNSFLCPHIVGLFCSYVNYFEIDLKEKNVVENFLEFLKCMYMEYKNLIFNKFEKDILSKKACYYKNDLKNKKIIELYDKVLNIQSFYDFDKNRVIQTNRKVYFSVDEVVKENEVFVWGNIDFKFININKLSFERFVKKLGEEKISIIARNSIMSTFNRYLYSKETNCAFNCVFI